MSSFARKRPLPPGPSAAGAAAVVAHVQQRGEHECCHETWSRSAEGQDAHLFQRYLLIVTTDMKPRDSKRIRILKCAVVIPVVVTYAPHRQRVGAAIQRHRRRHPPDPRRRIEAAAPDAPSLASSFGVEESGAGFWARIEAQRIAGAGRRYVDLDIHPVEQLVPWRIRSGRTVRVDRVELFSARRGRWSGRRRDWSYRTRRRQGRPGWSLRR